MAFKGVNACFDLCHDMLDYVKGSNWCTFNRVLYYKVLFLADLKRMDMPQYGPGDNSLSDNDLDVMSSKKSMKSFASCLWQLCFTQGCIKFAGLWFISLLVPWKKIPPPSPYLWKIFPRIRALCINFIMLATIFMKKPLLWALEEREKL